jgi:hypothetical protein
MDDSFIKFPRTPHLFWLNQTTQDWHTKIVTLSEAKGLAMRFFAALLMNKSVVRTAHATALFLRGSISAPRAMGYSE